MKVIIPTKDNPAPARITVIINEILIIVDNYLDYRRYKDNSEQSKCDSYADLTTALVAVIATLIIDSQQDYNPEEAAEGVSQLLKKYLEIAKEKK